MQDYIQTSLHQL